jgi:hypothetical protein
MVNKGLHLYNLFITRMYLMIYLPCAYLPTLLEFRDYIDNPKLLGYCSDSMISFPSNLCVHRQLNVFAFYILKLNHLHLENEKCTGLGLKFTPFSLFFEF